MAPGAGVACVCAWLWRWQGRATVWAELLGLAGYSLPASLQGRVEPVIRVICFLIVIPLLLLQNKHKKRPRTLP